MLSPYLQLLSVLPSTSITLLPYLYRHLTSLSPYLTAITGASDFSVDQYPFHAIPYTSAVEASLHHPQEDEEDAERTADGREFRRRTAAAGGCSLSSSLSLLSEYYDKKQREREVLELDRDRRYEAEEKVIESALQVHADAQLIASSIYQATMSSSLPPWLHRPILPPLDIASVIEAVHDTQSHLEKQIQLLKEKIPATGRRRLHEEGVLSPSWGACSRKNDAFFQAQKEKKENEQSSGDEDLSRKAKGECLFLETEERTNQDGVGTPLVEPRRERPGAGVEGLGQEEDGSDRSAALSRLRVMKTRETSTKEEEKEAPAFPPHHQHLTTFQDVFRNRIGISHTFWSSSSPSASPPPSSSGANQANSRLPQVHHRVASTPHDEKNGKRIPPIRKTVARKDSISSPLVSPDGVEQRDTRGRRRGVRERRREEGGEDEATREGERVGLVHTAFDIRPSSTPRSTKTTKDQTSIGTATPPPPLRPHPVRTEHFHTMEREDPRLFSSARHQQGKREVPLPLLDKSERTSGTEKTPEKTRRGEELQSPSILVKGGDVPTEDRTDQEEAPAEKGSVGEEKEEKKPERRAKKKSSSSSFSRRTVRGGGCRGGRRVSPSNQTQSSDSLPREAPSTNCEEGRDVKEERKENAASRNSREVKSKRKTNTGTRATKNNEKPQVIPRDNKYAGEIPSSASSLSSPGTRGDK